MKEYIEREAVEEFIQDGLNNPDKDKAFGHDAIEILAGIHFMLAADVAPVRHAAKAESTISKTGLMCTACYSDADADAAYCKYCGALLDGKEADHEVS